METEYAATDLTRPQVDASRGPSVLEFGANWCGFCQAAQPFIVEALKDYPDVKVVNVEDGPGRKLGRSFGVKLWPTLIFLRDGVELARAVRPQSADEVRDGLKEISPSKE